MDTISIPAAEAKRRLSDYLSRSAHSRCRVIVTRRGRPMAAIVSIQDLRELEQFDERKGLTSIVGKWRGFSEIAGAVRVGPVRPVGRVEMYLFDTDALTSILKPRPPKGLLSRLAAVPAEQQFTTTITISEIVYGAQKSDRPELHMRNLETVLLPAINVLGFDVKAAYIAGRIRAYLEANGQPMPFADLQIAAIAEAHDFILVTGNERHFRRVPDLRIENWLA